VIPKSNPTKIRGLVLAGNRREYSYYLLKTHRKGREYPQLLLFNQLEGYHTVPPIICVGSYAKKTKLVEIRRRAEQAGVAVEDFRQ
jgi:hypothetical protein